MFGRAKTNKTNPPVAPKPSFNTQERALQGEHKGLRIGPSLELQDVSRRTLLKGGSAALAGLTVLQVAGPAHALLGQSSDDGHDDSFDAAQALGHPDEEVLPWLDQPTENPFPDNLKNLLKWEELDSWRTPTDEFFSFNHFGAPTGLSEATWHLDIGGLVARPKRLSLADLKARRRREVDFTLECSGNNGTGLDFVIGAIGNARWGGARLAPLLEEAGVLEQGTEVVFWGADSAALTIRDDSGIVSGGKTGTVEPDAGGGLDLTITERFARSMSISEALHRDNLLCYEMNGEPLPPEHGFPVRLIAPGWYGVANVKWLTRIEVLDHRYVNQFMARDYVTIREEQRDGETLWTFTTVGHDRLKSAPAKVTRQHSRYNIKGAAWGAPIAAVEVRIDDGPWISAKLYNPPPPLKRPRGYTWKFWILDWGTPTPGEHKITSRALDFDGNIQPAPDDPFLASRRTFWESNGQITRRVLI